MLTLIFEKFSGGIAPEPRSHTEEGPWRPSPDSAPRGHLDCQVLRAPQYLNTALMPSVENVNENRNIATYASVNTDKHPVTRRRRHKSRKPTLGYFLLLCVVSGGSSPTKLGAMPPSHDGKLFKHRRQRRSSQGSGPPKYDLV